MQRASFTEKAKTNWLLHLQALEIFTKYYFTHDRLDDYARMISLYLAEMKSLPETDPDIYRELKDGNRLVNKNPNVPLVVNVPWR